METAQQIKPESLTILRQWCHEEGGVEHADPETVAEDIESGWYTLEEFKTFKARIGIDYCNDCGIDWGLNPITPVLCDDCWEAEGERSRYSSDDRA